MVSKFLRWMAALSVGALLLAGCSGESAEPSGPAKLRMVLWSSNPAQLKMFQDMGAEFVKLYPDVASSVEITPTAAGENYRTVLTTQIGGGDAPDIGWLGSGDLVDFASQNALVDLGPTVKEFPDYDYDDFIPAAMALAAQGDKVWGVPFSTSPEGIFYNADLFKQAGIPNPSEMIANGTWTWENLAAAASTIATKTRVVGYNLGAYKFDDNWGELNNIWAGYGASPWDGDKCTFTSPEMRESLQFFHDMIYKSGGYTKPGNVPDFPTGQVAMTSTYVSTAGTLKDAKFKWGLVPAPAGPKGAIATIGQSAIVAFKAGKRHDAAAKLVAFMTNKQNATTLAQFFPPARASILNADTLAKANPVLSKEQLEAVIVNGIKTGKLAPAHANMGDIQTKVRVALEKFWAPNGNVEEVTNQICADIDPILKK